MRPVLFEILGLKIPSYDFFVFLGLLIAIIIFYIGCKEKKTLNENFFFLFIAALVGGALGSKLPIWIYYYKNILAHPSIESFLTGRTIIGGIIGGWVAVAIVKKKLHITRKTGDIFAPALALGEAFGRIGCFLRGCCGGIATNLPWGMDFGDGIMRHPTQIYSIIFNFLLFAYLWHMRNTTKKEGHLFYHYIILYFSFRFLLEFIRTTPKIFYGLSGFQFAAISIIVYTLIKLKQKP